MTSFFASFYNLGFIGDVIVYDFYCGYFQENIYNVCDILDGGVFIVDLKQDGTKKR